MHCRKWAVLTRKQQRGSTSRPPLLSLHCSCSVRVSSWLDATALRHSVLCPLMARFFPTAAHTRCIHRNRGPPQVQTQAMVAVAVAMLLALFKKAQKMKQILKHGEEYKPKKKVQKDAPGSHIAY